MERIDSFTVDHNKLLRGVYVSRVDATPSGDVLTTFDIRMTLPNREAALEPRALHTIEHIAATFLRNHPQWASKVIYWGPMGCCTGNYLILNGDYKPADILDVLRETMRFIASYEGDVPGASAVECGNYKFMDLPGAKAAARRYLEEVLDCIDEKNMVYPQ